MPREYIPWHNIFERMVYTMKLWYCPYCNDYADIGRKTIRHKVDCEKKDSGMIKLDADMAPLIRVLNMHGYKTLYSCSGHAKENYTTSYIMFDKVYKDVRQAAIIAGLEYEECDIYVDSNGTKYYEFRASNKKSPEIMMLGDIKLTKTGEVLCIVRCNDYDVLEYPLYETYDLNSLARHNNILEKYLIFIELISFKYYSET